MGVNLTRNQIIIIFGVALIVIIAILIFVGVLPGRKQNSGSNLGAIGNEEQTEINFWGVEDEQFIRPVIDSYSQVNKAARIAYTQFSESDYEKRLVDAMASGQAPDILMLHNTWLSKHASRLLPLPAVSGFSITQLRQLFPQVVEADFSGNNGIYALPIYIDTLAFLYNKDFFDAKGVAVVPKNWNEFQYVIPRLRELDFGNKVVKAAAAIGGSEKSIDKATDLLSLIMLQSGMQMIDQAGNVDFARNGGEKPLNFYLQFSNPSNSVYTWNDNFRDSLDGFSQGTVAAIFNYQSSISVIKAKNPFLNLAVAPMIQSAGTSQPVNYADYWGLAVSNQSRNPEIAWNFIMYFTADQTVAEKYIQESKRPPALRSLIQKYLNDLDLGVFSQQALTARSWPQPDSSAVRRIFSDMIESISSGRLSVDRALEQAENEINEL
ncbi:MAG: extracellular solute-binding protein [Patescibacteria group bacterium]|mgnify:FL=1